MNDYTSLTDEQLIESKESFENIATELIIRYAKIVDKKASLYSDKSIEKDDLFQEGMLGLLSAIGHYNKEKNAGFRTFADRCIENRMKNAVKKASKSPNTDNSVDLEKLDEAQGVEVSPEEIMISKESADNMGEKIRKNLSPLEAEIFGMFLSGYTYEKIAKRKSITLKAVDNALQRARRKLKSIF